MSTTDNTSYFLKLFARGHYVTSRSIAHKEVSSEDPQRRHEERERFAVAAIAFCIKHDSQFRKYFLRIVANSQKTDIAGIEVEPKRWGDLVLEGKRDVIVLEFKLQALLAEHQDPNTSRFMSSGYGFEIKKNYGDKYNVRYIVVGRDMPAGCKEQGIPYQGLPWSAFLPRNREETALEHDLFECLAILGVPVFLIRNMKKKKLTGEAKGAMEVYQLLKAVAENIRTEVDSGIDYVGLDLRVAGAAPMSRHKLLNNVALPEKRSLGWIGYEQIGSELWLSVWFYSSDKGSKMVRKRLGTLESLKRGNVIRDQSSVGFRTPAANESDHQEWISEVLATVAGKTT